MATLIVNSQMQHFGLIQCITDVWTDRMQAIANFTRAPIFAGLEAMAQLAALHVRHRLNFSKHAFLLTIKYCDIPAGKHLDGRFALTADALDHSSHSFAYHVHAHDDSGTILNSKLLIGSRDYNQQFKKESIALHYQAIFNELRKQYTQ